MDGGRARRRSGRPDAHLRQLQRAGAPARRRHRRARARRSGVELPGVVRRDAAARPRGRRAVRDSRVHATRTAPRCSACSRSSRRPSPVRRIRGGARQSAARGGGDAPPRRRGLGAMGARAGCVGRRGRRRERTAAATPFAVPILGRVGRHDGPARMARAAQPRGVARSARHERATTSTGWSATACSSSGRCTPAATRDLRRTAFRRRPW